MRGMDAGWPRRWIAAAATLLGVLAAAAPAHAVATIAADTTRAPLSDPLAAGRSTVLTAGGLSRTLVRFRVQGLAGRPTRAVLRLRVNDPSSEGLQVRTSPAFTEDDGKPGLLLPSLTAIATATGAKAGTWAEWDVTKAVAGNGDVSLQVSGPLLDPASFSSREGAHAPQLVVTPDEPSAVRLAGLLDPSSLAQASFAADARDNLGHALDGLDVIEAPSPSAVPGRYIGVYHTLLAGRYVQKVATSDDLLRWTHRADLADHATQGTLVGVAGGGYLLAFERDTPDAQYVSKSNLVVRHYASWSDLVGGGGFTESDIPRTLAATAEGTPTIEVAQWNGSPASSQILIRFHYLKNIDVDRQAQGMLTNFSSWTAQPETAINNLFIALGTRGNLGDRADVVFEGHRFAVLEAQSIKANFGTWRWYLYDRDRGEARLLDLHGRAGSWAAGNPTVRMLTGPSGRPTLFVSGFFFSQGAIWGEAGQFIAVRPL